MSGCKAESAKFSSPKEDDSRESVPPSRAQSPKKEVGRRASGTPKKKSSSVLTTVERTAPAQGSVSSLFGWVECTAWDERKRSGSCDIRIPGRLAHGKSGLLPGDARQAWSKNWVLRLIWNSNESLIGIELVRLEKRNASGSGRYRTPIPPALLDLVGQFVGYFQTGQPLRGLNWEHVDDSRWTSFQRGVYQAIAKIPFGETRTYGWVAQRLRKPTAMRAVGQALRRNPMLILIPCHRVVSSKSIGGFLGASSNDDPELDLKRELLSLEEEYRNPIFPFLLLPLSSSANRSGTSGAVA